MYTKWQCGPSCHTSGVTSGSLQRIYFPEFSLPLIPHDVKKMSGIHSCRLLLSSQESQKFLDCQLGYFTVYADWAKDTVKDSFHSVKFTSLFQKCLCDTPSHPQQITKEMGRCGPVAKTVQSVETILCAQLVDAMVIILHHCHWKLLA